MPLFIFTALILIKSLFELGRKMEYAFYLEKCEVIRMTNKKKPLITSCKTSEHVLKSVDEKKFLGMALQKNLNWNKHAQYNKQTTP